MGTNTTTVDGEVYAIDPVYPNTHYCLKKEISGAGKSTD